MRIEPEGNFVTRNSSMRFVLLFLVGAVSLAAAQTSQRISLDNAVLLVDGTEPSYVQYAAKDLGSYLTEITGKTVVVGNSVGASRKAKTVIAVGAKMATAMGADLGQADQNTSVIRRISKSGADVVVVAGSDPHGTNTGVATLMQMIRADGKSAYLDGPLDLRNKPSFAVRGIHLNGWPLNYPYAFRSWKEADWKKFIDIAWARRINLFYLWPFMEILPVPLSREDEAYLQEVRRVVDYAKNQRGMEVWIMQISQPHRDLRLRHAGSQGPALLGQRLPEGHEPSRSAAVRAGAEVVSKLFTKTSTTPMPTASSTRTQGAGRRVR